MKPYKIYMAFKVLITVISEIIASMRYCDFFFN